MFIHDFNSVLINIGPLAVRWYSLAYIFGILIGIYYGKYLIKNTHLNISEKNLDDYVIWAVAGIILGGRIGYVTFYNFEFYLQNPEEIFKIWNGGMSFHGGLLGIIFTSWIFCNKNKVSFWSLTDLLACIAPIGIFFGRIANFINAELVGKATNVPWSVVFPQYDKIPRHPSQLYEACLEGIVLFIIVNFSIRKISIKHGYVSIIFLIFYSLFRIISEIFREPDPQLGYLFYGLSMGSILSLITICFGSFLIIHLNKR